MAKDTVKITKAPSPAPANLIMRRGTENDGWSVEAMWGVPNDALADTNHRWLWLDEYWDWYASKNMSKKRVRQRAEGHVMADRVWVTDKGREHSNNTMWFNRSKYHPVTAGRYLNSVRCQLRALNGTGKATTREATFKFEKPPKPQVSVEWDSVNDAIVWTASRPTLNSRQEMYDMELYITRQDYNWNASYKKEKRDHSSPYHTRDDEHTYTRNMAGEILTKGAWVRYKLKAKSRGVKGDSGLTISQYVFAYPAKAEISSITKTGWAASDVVRVAIKQLNTTKLNNTHPVDTVKLQRLANTDITSATTASLSNNWAYVDNAEDDGNCRGLYDSIQTGLPDVGKHTWYRIVTEHADFVNYSTPVMATCLDRTSSRFSNDKVWFGSISAGSKGTSIGMRLGWNNDDSTTTQVSWSTNKEAWRSNKEPEYLDVEWQDGTSQISGYAHSAYVALYDLETGVPVYVRARRYYNEDDRPQYGPWCYPEDTKYPITPEIQPTEVILSVPGTVERGSGIPCSWTFEGGEQTKWAVYKVVNGKKSTLMSGNGTDGGCTIPASKFKNMSSVSLVASVTCGGMWGTSDAEVVNVKEPPTLSVSVDDEMTAQPLSISLVGDDSNASVAIWVSSHGVGPNNPTGDNDQPYGDIVWATSIDPAWEEGSVAGTWEAAITAPEKLDLRENATYTVTAVSTVGSLSSAEASDDFTVNWAHQAIFPSESSLITVDEENLTATIVPIAPIGAAETDVCDVYRKTPDGAYLIAQDIAFGTEVYDPYAPYSNLPDASMSYLLCTRTVDGDIDWREVEYQMVASHLRIDWNGKFIELPLDVMHTTSFEKPFEAQRRLDGSIVGNWDAGAMRSEQVTLDLARSDMWEQASLLRELGQDCVPCFVRSHDGCAYEANVEVDSIELTYMNKAVPVSLRIQEIGLTDEFRQQERSTSGGESGESS